MTGAVWMKSLTVSEVNGPYLPAPPVLREDTGSIHFDRVCNIEISSQWMTGLARNQSTNRSD